MIGIFLHVLEIPVHTKGIPITSASSSLKRELIFTEYNNYLEMSYAWLES